MQSVMPRRQYSVHRTFAALSGMAYFWLVFTTAAAVATHLGLVRHNLGNITPTMGACEIAAAIMGSIIILQLLRSNKPSLALGTGILVASVMGYFFPLAMGM